MSKRSKSASKRRYVDMWACPSLHPTNIELMQKLKMADDRQFGTNMDVCGTVSEQDPASTAWEKTWLVGIRSDIWRPDENELKKSLYSLQQKRKSDLRREIKRSGKLSFKQSKELDALVEVDSVMQIKTGEIEKRRLILKLFRNSGNRMSWGGTIEEMSTTEIHNSIGSRQPLLTFAVLLEGHHLVTNLQQNHRTFRIPSIFTFCFFDEKNDRMWHIALKRKWFSIGADFLVESEGRVIGKIDGALIGFGYNAYVDVFEPDLAQNVDFLDLLTLFATSVGYQRAMRRSLKRRVKAVQQGQSRKNVTEHEELRLRENPRRRAA